MDLSTPQSGTFGRICRFSDVYVAAVRQRFTGGILLHPPEGDVVIIFRDGAPSSVTGQGITHDYLGELLVAFGDCTPEALAEALEIQQVTQGERPLVGALLNVTAGLGDVPLHAALTLQISRRLSKLFAIKHGHWQAAPGDSAKLAPFGMPIDGEPLIMPAIRWNASDDELLDAADALAGRALRLTVNPDDLRRYGADDADTRVLSTLTVPRRFDLLESSTTNRRHVRAVLRSLLLLHFVEILPATAGQPLDRLPTPSGTWPAAQDGLKTGDYPVYSPVPSSVAPDPNAFAAPNPSSPMMPVADGMVMPPGMSPYPAQQMMIPPEGAVMVPPAAVMVPPPAAVMVPPMPILPPAEGAVLMPRSPSSAGPPQGYDGRTPPPGFRSAIPPPPGPPPASSGPFGSEPDRPSNTPAMPRSLGRGMGKTPTLKSRVSGLSLGGPFNSSSLAPPGTPAQPGATPPPGSLQGPSSGGAPVPPPWMRPGPVPPVPPGMPPDLAQITQELLSVRAKLDQLNYYELLGVGENATGVAIRQQYTEYARRFHPDVFSQRAPQEVLIAAQEVTAVLNAAYAQLADPDKREQYVKIRQEQDAKRELEKQRKLRDNAMKFQMGLVLLRKKDLEGARELFKYCAEAEPINGLFRAHFAWSIFTDPNINRKVAIEKAFALLSEAVIMTKTEPSIHYFLGEVAKAMGQKDKARTEFRAALQLDGKHPDALREYRALGGIWPPPAQEEDAGLGGKISKLLKR